MRFTTYAAIFLTLILPLLIFLSVLEYAAFDNKFYEEKFSEYNVGHKVPRVNFIHLKIMDFVGGKSDSPPEELNDRERLHLEDVKRLKSAATIALYFLIACFALLLLSSAFILKVNSYLLSFVGKIMVFGGVLTIIFAVVLLLLINSDFSAAFDSFHRLFFNEGTYTFDPATEMLVRIYPEELFRDLGLMISKGVVISSLALVSLGSLLLIKPKLRKNG